MAVLSRGTGVASRARGTTWLAQVFAACGWFFGGVLAPAQSSAPSEYQLKAVFLFNFTQFVKWPPATFAAPDAPLVIGVLGPDPFGLFLDETVRGERIDGHPLEVRRYRGVAEIGACHVLFVAKAEAPRLREICARLRGRSVLTVGDMETFNAEGGMIGFFAERNRIRLRVNLEAARDAGLVISSKLLRAADIVGAPKE